MVLNLGGFSFTWKQLKGIGIESDFGISKASRIQNYPALIRANKEEQTVTLSGETLPNSGDKQKALKPLYELASLGQSYVLVNGNGKYFGKFAIAKISENQTIFTSSGSFFKQSFTLELVRDYDL